MQWTTPNILTVLRVALIPAMVPLFYTGQPWAIWGLFILYVLGALTDYLDGYLARRKNQLSDFGKFLDPIADKIFVASVMIMLIETQRVSELWSICILIILIREFVVSGLREYLAPKDISLPVTRLAKWKTATQMLALGFLILAPLSFAAHQAGLLLLLLATLLTMITGWVYLKSGLRHIKSSG